MTQVRFRSVLDGDGDALSIETDGDIEILDTQTGIKWNVRITEDSNLRVMTTGRIHIVPVGAVNVTEIRPHEHLVRWIERLVRKPDKVVS